MAKHKVLIYVLAGLIVMVGIFLIVRQPDSQETAMLSPTVSAIVTPGQTPEVGTPTQSATNAPDHTANPTPNRTQSPTARPTATQSQPAGPTPTHTTAPTPTHTTAPTPTATATPTPTQTPGFSYSVYNDDGVAPAGYTIVYVKITPSGSYHVTYDGSAITKTKTGSGYITYYKTVEKLQDGSYVSRVHVSAN